MSLAYSYRSPAMLSPHHNIARRKRLRPSCRRRSAARPPLAAPATTNTNGAIPIAAPAIALRAMAERVRPPIPRSICRVRAVIAIPARRHRLQGDLDSGKLRHEGAEALRPRLHARPLRGGLRHGPQGHPLGDAAALTIRARRTALHKKAGGVVNPPWLYQVPVRAIRASSSSQGLLTETQRGEGNGLFQGGPGTSRAEPRQ